MSTRPALLVVALLAALSALLPAHAEAAARSASSSKAASATLSAPSYTGSVKRPATTAQGTASAASVTRPDLLFGVHTDGDIYGGDLDKTDALERALGRRISIAQWYQNWGGNAWVRQVQPQLVQAVTASGRIPLLTWEPWNAEAYGSDPSQSAYSLDNINRGRFDSYIAQWADGLRATNTTVYLRLMHEMNGNWYPWGAGVNGNTPAKYRAAWKRIVSIFRARGAINVRFVWCPMTDSVPNTAANQMERYYPGAAYVDVLSLDGYNWGADHPEWGGWRSFSQVFGSAYQRLTRLGSQPVWFAEVGSAPEGGDKAAWVRDMFRVANGWTRLKGLVWFDVDKEEDWRADPDATVASAFNG